MTERKPNGLLTKSQREYLCGESEFDSWDAERAMKHRILKRAQQLPSDIALLANLSGRDVEKIALEMNADDLKASIEFLSAALEARAGEEIDETEPESGFPRVVLTGSTEGFEKGLRETEEILDSYPDSDPDD